MEILILVFYFFVSVLGAFSHFLKKRIKGETITEIRNYFKSHAKESIIAGISIVVSFAILIGTGTVNFVSAFGMGYMSDSVFNKWEKENKIGEKK